MAGVLAAAGSAAREEASRAEGVEEAEASMAAGLAVWALAAMDEASAAAVGVAAPWAVDEKAALLVVAEA